jgi:hypothetical protein
VNIRVHAILNILSVTEANKNIKVLFFYITKIGKLSCVLIEFIEPSYFTAELVILGGLVVSVLVIEHSVHGFNLDEDDGFLRAIKSLTQLPLEGK